VPSAAAPATIGVRARRGPLHIEGAAANKRHLSAYPTGQTDLRGPKSKGLPSYPAAAMR
jgi:hypothetical protein